MHRSPSAPIISTSLIQVDLPPNLPQHLFIPWLHTHPELLRYPKVHEHLAASKYSNLVLLLASRDPCLHAEWCLVSLLALGAGVRGRRFVVAVGSLPVAMPYPFGELHREGFDVFDDASGNISLWDL